MRWRVLWGILALWAMGSWTMGCGGDDAQGDPNGQDGSVGDGSGSDSTVLPPGFFGNKPLCNALDDPECWACYTDQSGEHCTQRMPDYPNSQPGWICWDDATGFTHCMRPDDAQYSANWTCVDNGVTVSCSTTTPDRPSNDPGWVCEEDRSEGLVCTNPTNPDLNPDAMEPGWYCSSDPTLGIVCVDATPETPDGTGGWECYEDQTGRHCSKESSDDPVNDPNWVCEEVPGEGLHCTRTSKDTPDGRGAWTCWYDDQGARHCDRELNSNDPHWECIEDATGVHCQMVAPDSPSNDPWWVCREDPTEGLVCVWKGPGYPDGKGGWICEETPEGDTICRGEGTWSDHPNLNPGWDCVEDPTEGFRCFYDYPDMPDGQAGWECAMNSWGDIICDHSGGDHPDIAPGWFCVDDSSEGISCIWVNPGYPDGDGGWSCEWSGMEVICHGGPGSSFADHPDVSPGWICVEDPAEGLVCAYGRADGYGTPDGNPGGQGTPDGFDEFAGEGSWDCVVAGDQIICSSPGTTTADHPDIEPGWVCREDPSEGVVCSHDATNSGNPGYPDNWGSTDSPDNQSGWSCQDVAGTRVCTGTGGSADHPDIAPGWVCVDDPAEGIVCSLAPGGWDCAFASDGNIVCTSAGTSISDHPDITAEWVCRDDPREGVICSWNPQDNHENSNRGAPDGSIGWPDMVGEWDCETMAGGVIVCSGEGTSADHPDIVPGWICYDDPAEGIVCQFHPYSDDVPDATGVWTCENMSNGVIVCTAPGSSNDHPDIGPNWSCFDDPMEGIVCSNTPANVPGASDVPDSQGGWDCTTANGQVICHGSGTTSDHPNVTPGWSCYDDPQEGIVCSKPTTPISDVPDGSGGWNCETVGSTVVCHGSGTTTDHPSISPGWSCYDDPQEGIICSRPTTPTDVPDGSGGWDCETVAGMVVCSGSGTTTDHPSITPGWSCYDDPQEGVICSRPTSTPSDTPDGSGGWDCTTAADGTITCSGDGTTSDHPDIAPGWTCYDDPAEGIICSGQPDVPGGTWQSWDCYTQPDGTQICTGPGTTSDYPDLAPGWNCYDVPSEGIVCEYVPPGGGAWDCETMADGTVVCEGQGTTSDHPDISPGWTCYDNPSEGIICEYPPGGGSWDCYTDANGVEVCVGEPGSTPPPGGGEWSCSTLPNGDVICQSSESDTPVPSAGWECVDNPTEGIICSYTNPDYPDDSGYWECVEDPTQGIICSTGPGDTTGDHPDIGPGWDCVDSAAEGVVCTNSNPDYPDGWNGGVPGGPPPGENPSDEVWDCYYTPEGARVCEQVPGNPYEPPDGTVPPGTCPTGTIEGRICAPASGPDFQWLVDALVYIDVPAYCNVGARRIADRTDAEGRFTLEFIPPGVYTVFAEKGSFHAEFSNVVVQANQVTMVPESFDSCIYLESARIAVITGEFDMIEGVLDRVGLSYDLYWGGYANCDPNSADPACDNSPAIELLTHLDQDPVVPNNHYMRYYDIIFFDCGTNMAGMADDPVVQGIIANNIRQYVNEGHSIYVSDWDWLFVEWAFPDKIDFLGNNDLVVDTDGDGRADNVLLGKDSELGPSSPQGLPPATVMDPAMKMFMGKEDVEIIFDLDHWSVMESVTSSVEIHIQGDVLTVHNDMVDDSPLLVSFKSGEGTVVFTAFHNIVAPSDDMNDILNFLIFEL